MKGDSAQEEQGTPPAESIKEELQGRCQEQRGCPITSERQPYRQDPTVGEVPREGTQGWGEHQCPARACKWIGQDEGTVITLLVFLSSTFPLHADTHTHRLVQSPYPIRSSCPHYHPLSIRALHSSYQREGPGRGRGAGGFGRKPRRPSQARLGLPQPSPRGVPPSECSGRCPLGLEGGGVNEDMPRDPQTIRNISHWLFCLAW